MSGFFLPIAIAMALPLNRGITLCRFYVLKITGGIAFAKDSV
jgi:hypothetical protein